MPAELTLYDATDTLIDLTETNPIAFGTQEAGATTPPVEVQVANTGDEDLFYVTVQATEHPTNHVGDTTNTLAATQIATSQDGNYEPSQELGTLAPGATVSVWVRWVIPEQAPAGDVIWALEALGQTT